MTSYLSITLLCLLSAGNFFCKASGDHAIIDEATQRDLNLVRSEKTKTLSDAIGATITQGGKDALDRFLLNPTDRIKTISGRQGNISFLLKNDKALPEKLSTELRALSAHELALTQNYHTNNPLAEKALNRVYFSWPWLKQFNTNPHALDAAYMGHITILCAPLAIHVIESLLINRIFQPISNVDTHQVESMHNHESSQASHNADQVVHHHGDHRHNGCSHGSHNHVNWCAAQAFHWLADSKNLYNMGESVYNNALMIKSLQEQMIKVARYVQHARDIHGLLKEHGADNNFEPFAQLERFFKEKPACSPECEKLFDLLKRSTFTGNASVLSRPGNVLAAYETYNVVRQEFKLLTQVMSEIDVYLSIAGLIKNQTPGKPWSFVKFKDGKDKEPQLIINGFHHPFIQQGGKQLDFSSATSQRTLVTGDNGSGKSTYLTGVGHVLITAHVFGVVPAAHCELKPVSCIRTFRFIKDTIAEGTQGGVSRFYAECARMIEITAAAEKNGPNPSVVLIDEPFTFTTAQKGTQHLQEALSKLEKLPETISVVATHYDEFGSSENEWTKVHLAKLQA